MKRLVSLLLWQIRYHLKYWRYKHLFKGLNKEMNKEMVQYCINDVIMTEEVYKLFKEEAI